MQKKYFNNLITSTLIITTILMPISLIPKKAEAQSYSGYVGGIAPLVASLPQCKDVLKNGVKNLFNGIGGVFKNGEAGGEFDNYDFKTLPVESIPIPTKNSAIPTSLNTIVNSATNTVMSPAVSDAELQKLQKKANDDLARIADASEYLNANSSCIQSIGRLIIKRLVQKLTVSTVNWINTGFDGQPAFIQNPSKFFRDIAKNEILQFGVEINDPELFPFGKAWMQNTAAAFNNKFQDNARYSLDEEIQNTNPEWNAATFRADFSQGGWDAWTAMTQSPANNPIGFKIMADNEIQKRLSGTTQSTAEQVHEALSQANGFLGDYRCSADSSMTQSQVTAALSAGQKNPCEEKNGIWEYVTPGSMVAAAATNVMGYQNNAYLNVEDLNDAVAAITDALLAHYSQNIYDKGFANIGTEGADGSLYFDPSGINDGTTYASRTQKDFMPSQLSSSWLQANPDFDIRKDLTQALIDEQRTYSDKLALQNKELSSTIDGKPYKIDAIDYTLPDGTKTKVSNAYGLLPAIYQLDYCIPGPHPGWEEDSRNTLNSIIIPAARQPKNDTIGSTIKSAVGVGLNFVPYVGPVLSSLFAGLSETSAGALSFKTRQEYSFEFFGLTGYLPRIRQQTPMDPVDINMSSSDGLVQVLNTILDRYTSIMNKTYFSSPDMLPTIAKEAARDYNQIAGYNQIIKDNEDKILSLKTTVKILGEIKDEVDDLNAQYPNGGEEYETKLKTQINAFGRLSAEMVNGDDITGADNLAKQIVDKKNYIYKNLLKGPYGCEADLEKPENIKNFPSAGNGVKGTDWSAYTPLSVKRMTYPSELPIIYDYNKFSNENILPDPWESGYKENKMITDTKNIGTYGPGFLSFVYFSQSSNDGSPRAGIERLGLGDLVDTYDAGQLCQGPVCVTVIPSKFVSVGERKSEGEARGGMFEHTINIY